jgi:hypothetical protein
MSEHADFVVRQEDDAVDARRLGRVGVVSVVAGAAGVFFSSLLLVLVTGTLRPSAAGPAGPRPAPRALSGLEQTPILDAREGLDRREAQRRELSRWGWADRKARVAVIPIDRAIDVVVAQEAR